MSFDLSIYTKREVPTTAIDQIAQSIYGAASAYVPKPKPVLGGCSLWSWRTREGSLLRNGNQLSIADFTYRTLRPRRSRESERGA